MKQANVLIIYTGGTIGMIEDPETGSLKPFDFKHLSQEIPELKKIGCSLSSHSFSHPIDSSDMSPEVWRELVTVIEENYDHYDGFVILHGSDTMAYTASALSFMLEGLNKAVILTGAQLPIGTLRTDGKENLITAIEIAAARKEGRSRVPEVAIYFEYKLYRGNRTRKLDAEDFEAFQSLNYPLLAEAGVSIKYNDTAIQPWKESRLKVHKELNDDIAILKLFPGINKVTVNAILDIPGLKGVIIETYGSGNAPTTSWFLESIGKAIRNGIVILNITQCNGGTVKQGKYQTSLGLEKAGVTGGGDMTTEAAVTKLIYLFGSGLPAEEVKTALLEDLRGELSL